MSSRPSKMALTSPGRMRLYSTLELISMPPPTWQVEGMLPQGGLAGLYGPPGSYKSFLAMDFSLCVATGKPWNGRKVEKGPVLYIAAEGGRGIGIRAKAWLEHHKISPAKADISWLLEALPIYGDSEDVDAVFERLLTEVKKKPSLTVIDTLARCFDGNENEQEDMGRFIKGADRFRTELDSTVLIVHHTRLDGDRERGNTAFRGAADCMLAVARQGEGGGLVLDCNKQKDAEEFGMIGLRLHAVEGTSSCVLVPTKTANAADKERYVVEALRVNGGLTYAQLFTAVEEHMSLATMKRTLRKLEEKGYVSKEDDEYRLTEAHV